jgi:hypothetical protein
MWQCIWVRGGELSDIITAPTLKMTRNIGHWIVGCKYEHFSLDVAVHLAERWWIGWHYYSTHFKNDSKHRALNLKVQIWSFLTWCGGAFSWEVVDRVTLLQHWISRYKYRHFWLDVAVHLCGRWWIGWQEILGTELWDVNMNISALMWQCI